MEYIRAFLVGGIICILVQILMDHTTLQPGRIMVLLVIAGVILGALGIYKRIEEFGGCGATVPLSGFGFSLWKGMKEAVDNHGPRPSRLPRPRASPALWVPARRTAFSLRPSAAGTTSWSACTTIRAISPSRPSASSTTVRSRSGRLWRASMSRWACPSSAPAWTMAPTSTMQARATAMS